MENYFENVKLHSGLRIFVHDLVFVLHVVWFWFFSPFSLSALVQLCFIHCSLYWLFTSGMWEKVHWKYKFGSCWYRCLLKLCDCTRSPKRESVEKKGELRNRPCDISHYNVGKKKKNQPGILRKTDEWGGRKTRKWGILEDR